ncbi:MAG: peptidase [Opitutae bacterium]|nr:peptidase [Opitutae bacterium]
MTSPLFRRAACAAALFLAPFAAALTSPQEHFGFAIGDDYHLATYTQTEAYFKKLAAESDRLKLVDIGPTEEGRRQYLVICTSPANLAKLDRYKEIAQKLARAEGVTEAQARALAAEGKAVVWIDGGLHATETLGAAQLTETLWRFASRADAETLRILDHVIILFTHANPDGQELISSWYMRRPDPATRIVDREPRLYQKYAGHDNNRDFMLTNMKESQNMARQLYLEWFPQIVYNHHQPGPTGTIVAGPPYRDPFNYVFDPLLVAQLDSIGSAMHSRWLAEGKAGSTMKRGSVFSTWWNGGLRTTVYFHNMLGLLTETVGSPTPMEIPLVPERQIPSGDLPMPAPPQPWHFRSSIEYSLTANYAVLNHAARHRDELLFNIWRMGANSIERGGRDHWSLSPKRVEAMRAAAKPAAKTDEDDDRAFRFASQTGNIIPSKLYDETLKKPELRDPRGYIIPRDQADFPTAVKFINTLVKSGIALHRATADFTVAGKNYAAGSYIVKAAQAFRPFVLDAFEPQDHPNDFQYEGGPPIAPYDSAGWTVAYQMGVKFDRVLDAFDGPFERLPYGELQNPPAGKVAPPTADWLVDHRSNNSFLLINRLLKAGAAVYWLKTPPPGHPEFGHGAIYIPSSKQSLPIIERAAIELGLNAVATNLKPTSDALKLAPMRIALWDQYGGSMSSGWTRWLFEQFEFPFEVVYPQQIDAGNLRAKYDVIVLVTGAVPPLKSAGALNPRLSDTLVKVPAGDDLPAAYRGWTGSLTEEKSIPALREFAAQGGSIIAIGTSTNLAYHLGVPVRSALVEMGPQGKERPLPRDKFYVPGSILRVAVDSAAPLAWGMESAADVYFDNSPVFKLLPEAAAKGVKPIAWFASAAPLRSGWAWGQSYLDQGVAALEAPMGTGKLWLLGPEVAFRAGTHGTYKLLFNGLYLSTARPVN